MKAISIGIAILFAACGSQSKPPLVRITPPTTVSIPETGHPVPFVVCVTPDGYAYTTSPLTGCLKEGSK